MRLFFPTRPPSSRRFWTVLLTLLVVGCAAGSETSWKRHAPSPAPRTELAAAVVGSSIVAVGGFAPTGANTARTDAYSIVEDRWRRLPDLPVAVDHAAATSAGGRAYVIGGYGADRRPLRAAYVLERGRWRALVRPPEARAAAAAAIANGILYVVGGVDERRGLARVALALDLRSGRWSRVPGPSPREHLAAAASNGRVYALGGRDAGYDTNVALVETLAPGARQWTRLPALPHARGGTGAAVVSGRLLSVGGEEPEGTIASVYAYRPSERRWRRLADLPTPRHGLGVVAHRGRVFVVGGGPEPGLTTSGAVESLAIP